jgi:hypothetical protein
MAKDERLYARFDIAMDEHPKIMLLSDSAFRTLIEVTFFSRRQMTDGFLADGVVRRRWPPDAIAELQSNDPERPSLYPCTKAGVVGLMIHDFEKHQTTTADIEAKREAGRKGGLAKAKQASSKPVAPASDVPLAESKQTSSAPLAITETETETETSTSNEVEKDSPAKRGTRLSEDWMPSAASIAKVREDAPNVDHQAEHATFVDYWIAQPGQKGVKTNWDSTWRNWMRRKQGDIRTIHGGKQTRTEQNLSVVAQYAAAEQPTLEITG